MEYNKGIQRTFALRTIQNYKETKDVVKYSITHVANTLLGVLTALMPDYSLCFINTELLDELPYKTGEMSSYQYLYNMRNALAHKTVENFMDLVKFEEIKFLQFKSNGNERIRLTEEDLNRIIDILESRIIREIDLFDILMENIDLLPGETIIKPKTDSQVFKGKGKRRNQDAIIYKIKSKKDPNKFYEKGITKSELNKAFVFIYENKDFGKEDFEKIIPECASEGSCNFTTIGGIFEYLKIASYQKGYYQFNQI